MLTRIRSVDTQIVPVPRPAPFFTSTERISTADTVLVKVQSDDDISGMGYCWAPGLAKARVLESMIHELGQAVIGQDPENVRGLWNYMWKCMTFFGHSGVSVFALSAIDLAIWDLIGKLRGQPVYKLLGAAAHAIPCYASGLFLTSSLVEIEREAESYLEKGFRAVKMKVGQPDIRTDLERVAAVRHVLGTDVNLMVDAVQQWNPSQALAFANRVAEFGIFWFEDPLPYSCLDDVRKLRAKINIPIAMGEFSYTPFGIKDILDHEAADTLILSVPRIGGITGWMSAVALAATRNIPVSSHILPDLSAHVMAATSNAFHMEYMDWWSALFDGIPIPKDGLIETHDAPGLGIDIRLEAREKWNIQL